MLRMVVTSRVPGGCRTGHKDLYLNTQHALSEQRILGTRSPLVRAGSDPADGGRLVSPGTPVTLVMPRPTTEPHAMPICSSTLPTCAACGAFLAPAEHEAHLLSTSTLSPRAGRSPSA